MGHVKQENIDLCPLYITLKTIELMEPIVWLYFTLQIRAESLVKILCNYVQVLLFIRPEIIFISFQKPISLSALSVW